MEFSRVYIVTTTTHDHIEAILNAIASVGGGVIEVSSANTPMGEERLLSFHIGVTVRFVNTCEKTVMYALYRFCCGSDIETPTRTNSDFTDINTLFFA